MLIKLFVLARDTYSASVLDAHIIIATKDDRLLCITWHGELMLQRSLHTIDIAPLPPDADTSATPNNAATSANAAAGGGSGGGGGGGAAGGGSMASGGASGSNITTNSGSGSGAAAAATAVGGVNRKPSTEAPRPHTSNNSVAAQAHAVVQIATSAALRSLALLLVDGRVALLRFDVPPANVALAAHAVATARGTWLRSFDATQLAFNARHKLLAVGGARFTFCSLCSFLKFCCMCAQIIIIFAQFDCTHCRL